MKYFSERNIKFLVSPKGKKYCQNLGKVTGEILCGVISELSKSGVTAEKTVQYLAPSASTIVLALSSLPIDDVEQTENAKESIQDTLVVMMENDDSLVGN